MPDLQTWLPRGLVFAGLAVIVAGLTLSTDRTPRTNEPVTLAEAEALLDQAVRLAQAGDFAGLCESVSGRRGVCGFLLESAEDMHRTPGDLAPTVVGSAYHGETTLVLRLRGVTGEGVPYEADFPVSREGGSEPRCSMPVYWSGVQFMGA
jgi:hypothetical protein